MATHRLVCEDAVSFLRPQRCNAKWPSRCTVRGEFSDVNRDNRETPMTETDMGLSELLATQNGGDFLRGVAEAVPRPIVEADGDGPIGAGRHEREYPRTTWRNGYRKRALDTRLGTLNLKAPKPRQGNYAPGFPEPRKTSETAPVAVV